MFSPGVAANAGGHRSAAEEQVEAGQPVDGLAGTPPHPAPPVLHGQHECAALQHPQLAHRSTQDVQCRGHGPQKLWR